MYSLCKKALWSPASSQAIEMSTRSKVLSDIIHSDLDAYALFGRALG